MKRNITLSADSEDIELARKTAKASNLSLNDAFRQWLQEFTGQNREKIEVEKLFERFSHIKIGRKFSRDEMNER